MPLTEPDRSSSISTPVRCSPAATTIVGPVANAPMRFESAYTPNDPAAWDEMTDRFQSQALSTRLGIPIFYGVDAVHGDGDVKGSVLFPHHIGMGATRNPDIVQRAARVTARGPSLSSRRESR